MSKLKVFIVEDEPIYADQLEILVKEAGFWHIGGADNAKEAYEMIETVRPDFVLLDINIKGDVDGIELADRINQLDSELFIIYVTSYQDERTFARASKTAPIAYLPKPIDEKGLLRTLELLVQRIGDLPPSEEKGTFLGKSIFLKADHKLEKVKLTDIRYIEIQNRVCVIDTVHQQYTIRRSLQELEEKLPQGLLTRVHRSYLVNMSFMDSYDTLRNRIIIEDQEVPVSKAYKSEIIGELETL